MPRLRVEVSGGFLLLAAFLYYMDTDGLVLWAALACAAHEAGHLLAIRLLGGWAVCLRLTCVGAELRLSPAGPKGRGFRFWTALAGPAVNLLLAPAAARMGAALFAGVNLSLGCFNLLPIAGLDGGRAVAALLEGRWGWRTGRFLSAGTALALTGGGLWLMVRTANPTLLLTGGWLTAASLCAAPEIAEKIPCNQSGRVVNYFSLKKGCSSAPAAPRESGVR